MPEFVCGTRGILVLRPPRRSGVLGHIHDDPVFPRRRIKAKSSLVGHSQPAVYFGGLWIDITNVSSILLGGVPWSLRTKSTS